MSNSAQLPSSMPERRQSMPLLWWMLALGFVLLGTLGYYLSKVAQLTEDHRNTAVIFQQSLQASIDQFEYLPSLVATNPEVRQLLLSARKLSDSTPSEFERQRLALNTSLQFTAERSGADIVYLMDALGAVRAASNYSESTSFLDQNYAFRPYFYRAKQTRSRQFYFAKGSTTGVPGFFISAPVLQGEEFLGVVVVKLELESLTRSWELADHQVLVSDANGIVIITANPAWQYRLVEPLSKDDLNRLQQERQFPGESPSLLYQHRDSLIGLNASGPDVWQIQDTAWLVNHSPIPGMGWTLHQVRKQSEVLLPTLVCLMGLSLVAGLWLMFMAERRKKAEYQLSVQLAEVNRREDLQRLIDNIHIGVLICSEEGGITSMNDYAENLLLAGADFHAGQRVNLVDLLKIQSLQSLEDHLLVKPETPQYAETWTRIGEQPVPVMFAVSRVEYAGRQQYLMTLINIAKRKRAEDELVRLNASLEETVQERTQALESAQKALLQKSKAAALGKMAATIVHELSQPLSAMNSSVAALESKLKRENWDGAAQSASRLKPLSSKMQRVIRMLKHFSYEDQQEAESLDLFALVNQVIEVNQDQLQERGIELSFLPKIPSFSHCVMGSSLKMDLAISNLLRNAMDAAEDQPHPRIQIHLSRDDGWLKLTVQDNGGGVAPALMDQLFDPYVTTKKVGKGIGLGLSITQEVVQQMNGRLEVKNTEGGACFTVLMPGNA